MQKNTVAQRERNNSRHSEKSSRRAVVKGGGQKTKDSGAISRGGQSRATAGPPTLPFVTGAEGWQNNAHDGTLANGQLRLDFDGKKLQPETGK